MLLAIAPDQLIVDTGKETFEANHLIAPVRLGENAGGFDALIGLD